MHDELATPPALLCPARLLPHSRFSQHDHPAMWRGLSSSHLLLSGRRRSCASMSSAQPGWPFWSQSTGLTDRLYVVCPPPMRWLASLKCRFA